MSYTEVLKHLQGQHDQGSHGKGKFGIQSNRVTLSTGTEARASKGKISAQVNTMNRGEFIRSLGGLSKSVKRNYDRVERVLGRAMSGDEEKAFRQYFIGLITHDEATNRIGAPPAD